MKNITDTSSPEDVITLPTLKKYEAEETIHVQDKPPVIKEDKSAHYHTEAKEVQSQVEIQGQEQESAQVEQKQSIEPDPNKLNEIYENEKKKGYEEGYALGYEEAEKKVIENNRQAEQELILKTEKMDKCIAELSDFNKENINGNQAILLEIIYEAVCKIVLDSTHDKERLLNSIRDFLDNKKNSQFIELEVSETDYEFLKNETDLIKHLPDNIVIRPSSKVLSGYFSYAKNGSLDSRLETRLQEFKKTLLDHQAEKSTHE